MQPYRTYVLVPDAELPGLGLPVVPAARAVVMIVTVIVPRPVGRRPGPTARHPPAPGAHVRGAGPAAGAGEPVPGRGAVHGRAVGGALDTVLAARREPGHDGCRGARPRAQVE